MKNNIIGVDIATENSKDYGVNSIIYNNEIYDFFDTGLTRKVYVNKDKTKVLKVLIDDQHKNFNLEEIKIYENSSEENRSQMAKTKSLMNGLFIEQEFCNPIKFDDREMTIKELKFSLSCRGEVGWNSEGKLVCFDLDEFKKY